MENSEIKSKYKETPKRWEEFLALDKSWFEQKYIAENLGVYEISCILKLQDTSAISKRIEQFGIPKKVKTRASIKQSLEISKESFTKQHTQTKNAQFNGTEYSVGEKFRLAQDLLKAGQISLKKDQLVEIEEINLEKEMLKIKDVYTHMNHLWVLPSMLYWPESQPVEEIPVEGEQNASNL